MTVVVDSFFSGPRVLTIIQSYSLLQDYAHHVQLRER